MFYKVINDSNGLNTDYFDVADKSGFLTYLRDHITQIDGKSCTSALKFQQLMYLTLLIGLMPIKKHFENYNVDSTQEPKEFFTYLV